MSTDRNEVGEAVGAVPGEADRASGSADEDGVSTQQAEATPGATDAGAPYAARAPASSSDWELVQEELRRLRGELAEARGSLAEAQERADRYHANWQRSAADFLNWKRRADQEKADATRLGEAAVIADLLRVLDDFERAFGALPPELRRLTWIEGIHMIWGKMFTIFESRGLRPIEAEGRDFDPREHEAVMREDDADPSEQTTVVQELQRGYRLHDRVLRPTLVKVGRPKATDTEAAQATGAATADPTGAQGTPEPAGQSAGAPESETS
jgi:molecular chaperone GrpE